MTLVSNTKFVQPPLDGVTLQFQSLPLIENEFMHQLNEYLKKK